jgi:hypothetical protein
MWGVGMTRERMLQTLSKWTKRTVQELGVVFAKMSTSELESCYRSLRLARLPLIRDGLRINPDYDRRVLADMGVERLIDLLCDLAEEHIAQDEAMRWRMAMAG